jgi:hypothetical protein
MAKQMYNPKNAATVTTYGLVLLADGKYKEGFDMLLKAANMGDAEAMYNLATLYKSGKGVTRNLEQTKFWLEKSVTFPAKKKDGSQNVGKNNNFTKFSLFPRSSPGSKCPGKLIQRRTWRTKRHAASSPLVQHRCE